MPKVKGLTRAEREAQAGRDEMQRVSREFLGILGERRGREEKTFAQMAEYIGVCPDCYQDWRKGKLPSATFGRIVEASRRVGYRIEFVPIGK